MVHKPCLACANGDQPITATYVNIHAIRHVHDPQLRAHTYFRQFSCSKNQRRLDWLTLNVRPMFDHRFLEVTEDFTK
jgi:hypothetical protein